MSSVWEALAFLSAVFPDADLGDPRCKCAPSVEMLPSVLESERVAYDVAVNMTTYGVTCGQHDKERPLCASTPTVGVCDGSVQPPPSQCTGDGKEWCSDRWCYVDPANCSVAMSHSRAFPSSGRYYSYATCGNLDVYSATKPLAGKVLSLGIQSNSGGWHGSYHPSKTPHVRDDLWKGPLWDFVQATAASEGFTLNITSPPDRAVAASNHSSSFWHCTYGTGMGFLDLCVGMHTVTATRLRISPWFVVQLNPLSLIVKLDEPPTLMDLVQNTFQPLKPELWLAMVAAILLLGVAITFQERLSNAPPQDWSDERNPTKAQHLTENITYGLRSLYDGGVGHSSNGFARVTQMGLGFFVLLFISAYTANLTTFLVTRNQKGQIESWKQAQEMGLRVCGTRMGSTTARKVYPTANWIKDPADGILGVKRQADVLEYMSLGYCDVAVMDWQDLHVAQSEGYHCDKTKVGEPIADETVGMPLNGVGTLAQELAQAFARQMELGTWDASKTKYYAPSKCAAKKKSAETARLGVPDLLGAFALLVVFTVIGLGGTITREWMAGRVKGKGGASTKQQAQQILAWSSFVKVLPKQSRSATSSTEPPQNCAHMKTCPAKTLEPAGATNVRTVASTPATATAVVDIVERPEAS